MRTKVEGMTTRVRELEAVNSSLQRRIQEIQDRMDEMAVNHRYYRKQLGFSILESFELWLQRILMNTLWF